MLILLERVPPSLGASALKDGGGAPRRKCLGGTRYNLNRERELGLDRRETG